MFWLIPPAAASSDIDVPTSWWDTVSVGQARIAELTGGSGS